MFQVVFGEDGDGTVFGEAAIEERLSDRADRLENLGVGELAPCAVPFPFGYADFVRRDFRPVDEAIGEDSRVRSQGFVSANQDRAIGVRTRGRAGSAQADGTDAIVELGLGGHFIAVKFLKIRQGFLALSYELPPRFLLAA